MRSGLPQVLITDFVDSAVAIERKVLDGIAEVHALEARSEDELAGRLEAADALMVYHTVAISRTSLTQLRHCRLIVRCGVGVDNVDVVAASEFGIAVVNVPDYGTEEVADSAIGLTLSLCRGISFLNSWLRGGGSPWSHASVAPLHRLRCQRFGIIGLGRIGTATALRAKALGMHVRFHDPYKEDGHDKALGIQRVETLDDLLSESQVVSLHCPLTTETKHMIDRQRISQMPRASFLVNTARGGLVETAVIPDAVESGQLAGAGFDVLEREPPGDEDPLIRAWQSPSHPAHHRVIINPHASFYSEQGFADMRTKGAEACRRALTGLPVRNLVN